MENQDLLTLFTAFAVKAVRTNEEQIITKECPDGTLKYEIPGVESIYKSTGQMLAVSVYSERFFKVPNTVTIGSEVYETKILSSDICAPWVEKVSLTGTFDEE